MPAATEITSFQAWITRDSGRLQALENRLTSARAAVFLLGLAGSLVFALRGNSALALGWAAVAVVVFAFFVREHWKVMGGLRRRAAAAAIFESREARSRLNWDLIPNQPPGDPSFELPRYFSDLDLVGDRSLLRLANWTRSDAGWEALLSLFMNGAGAESRARSARVRALVSRPMLRRQLWQRLGNEPLAARRLEGLLEHPVTHGDPRPWIVVIGLMQLTTVTLFTGFMLAELKPWFIFPLALVFAIQKAGSTRFHGAYDRALEIETSLEKILQACLWLETRTAPDDPALAQMLAAFHGRAPGAARPSRLLRRLARVIALLGFRGNPLAHAIVNVALPWDWWLSTRLERLRVQARVEVPRWTQALAELEAAASLAELADSLGSSASWAEVLEGGDVAFEAESLAHPLIPASRRVSNPAKLDSSARCLLVTGSNMAGKSTYLRTIAVNWLLARAGAPVLASRARVRVDLELETCLRIADSVTDEVSSFYAEVRALKRILESAAAGSRPVLYFIDEIYRGTNQRERVQGSAAYLEELTRRSSFGLVATHDLELARLAERIPTMRNFHFEETIIRSSGPQSDGRDSDADARMEFTYVLREGPSRSTNALRIMALAGLPTESSLGC